MISVYYFPTGDTITLIKDSFYRVQTAEGKIYRYDLDAQECSCQGWFYNGKCRHLELPRIAIATEERRPSYRTLWKWKWRCPYCGAQHWCNKKYHWRTGKKRCSRCGKRVLIALGRESIL